MATDREILLTQQQHSDLSRHCPVSFSARRICVSRQVDSHVGGCPSFHLSFLSLTMAWVDRMPSCRKDCTAESMHLNVSEDSAACSLRLWLSAANRRDRFGPTV